MLQPQKGQIASKAISLTRLPYLKSPYVSLEAAHQSNDICALYCPSETLSDIRITMAGLMSSAGAYVSRLWKRDPDYVRVCLLGPGDAGKTTLLYRLVLGETVTTMPTIGFYCEYRNSMLYFQGQSIKNSHS